MFLGLIAATLLLACNQAPKTDSAATTTAAATATNGPVMKFDTESFDFGKIPSGDKVTYNFKFTNTGKSPLIIKDAVASCGCTVPEWSPKTPIMPGNKGVIHVVFNSTGKEGLQDKLITITSNTNPPQNMVHLVGEVIAKK